MELSFPHRSLSTLLLPHRTISFSSSFSSTSLFPLPRSLSPSPLTPLLTSLPKSGRYHSFSHVRALDSEETSTFVTEKLEVGPTNTAAPEKKIEEQEESPTEPVPTADESPVDFLNKLDVKLDSDVTYSVLLYGSGALVALWLSSAVVGALDSIPVFPKVMEVVGLGFTVWFSYRYLIFKKNREELLAKIADLKELVIGTADD